MKDFNFSDVMSNLSQSGFDLRTIAIIALATLLVVMLMFLLTKKRVRPVVADNTTETTDADNTTETTDADNTTDTTVADKTHDTTVANYPLETIPVELTPFAASTMPEPTFSPQPKPETAKAVSTHIPQDTILRRNYLAHIRYMLETVTFPRPTEIVLRRHYDHLIASQLEACVEDEAELNKLIRRYDEHRRNTAINSRTISDMPSVDTSAA